MPQSTTASRQKLQTIRALRDLKREQLTSTQQPHVIRGEGYALVTCTPNKPPQVSSLPPHFVRWANKPFKCTQGWCVAVGLQNGAVCVLVKSSALIQSTSTQHCWYSRPHVLSITQFNLWVQTGF